MEQYRARAVDDWNSPARLRRLLGIELPVQMITDVHAYFPPLREEFLRSDQLRHIDTPTGDDLRDGALGIIEALDDERPRIVRSACQSFLLCAARFYGVSAPPVQVLGVQPKSKCGDYHTPTRRIRIWMRDAATKHVVSPPAFLNTLCHEFMHHLDAEGFGMPNTPHTRGFYIRTRLLYHHVTATPVMPLRWFIHFSGRYEVDHGPRAGSQTEDQRTPLGVTGSTRQGRRRRAVASATTACRDSEIEAPGRGADAAAAIEGTKTPPRAARRG